MMNKIDLYVLLAVLAFWGFIILVLAASTRASIAGEMEEATTDAATLVFSPYADHVVPQVRIVHTADNTKQAAPKGNEEPDAR